MAKKTNQISQITKHLEDFKYFLSVERSVSNNTTLAYLTDCSRFVEFLNENHPNLPPNDITLPHINEFLDIVIAFKGRSGEEKIMRASSLTRVIQSLRAFFKYLIFVDAIEKDVSGLITTPKMDKKLPDILEQNEIFAMMDTLDISTYFGFRNYLTIELLYATGLRVSEFINLKLENINFKEEYLDIIGKGDKERLIPIASKVLNDLSIYIDTFRSTRPISQKYKDFVFLSHKRGTKMTRQFINKMLNEVALQTGIQKKIHPHILRHSFATELIRSGASLIAIKEMMGHASITSTEIYINLKTDDLKQTLQKYHPFYK